LVVREYDRCGATHAQSNADLDANVILLRQKQVIPAEELEELLA
jgi:hypothetical protein